MSASSGDVSQGLIVERRVPVPMRDGTILRADVYRPDDSARHPVLLEHVCYEPVNRGAGNGALYAQHGYAVVIQSVRGTFGSEGTFAPFQHDAWGADRDGYDGVEWAAARPWSNGRVGMLDGSFSGFTQYLTAPTRPPHLAALSPRQSGGDAYDDFVYRYGTYGLFYLDWAMRTVHSQLAAEEATDPGRRAAESRLKAALKELDHWHWHLPLSSCPPLEGIADWYFEHVTHPEYGPYWWPTSLSLVAEEVDVPILHVGSWYDIFIAGTLRAFTAIRARSRSPESRASQRLIVGPWIHGPSNVGRRVVGELDFGPEAELDLQALRLRWYGHWLKGEPTGALDGPPVRVFLMGANRWLDLPDWPPPDARPVSLYLREGTSGTAESLNAGALAFEPPAGAERPDSYRYDPMDPVPSLVGFPGLGPKDYRPVELRMLTYTTGALTRDLAVVGPVAAELYALSSAPDTDWMVRLCDVWPDGRSMLVCDGVLRASYRDSLERPEPMLPGHVYRFAVDLWSTAQVFQAGHRIRVHVTSSDFPRYDRNLNTGERFGAGVRTQAAINTIFHDPLRPSRLVVRVMDEVGSSSQARSA